VTSAKYLPNKIIESADYTAKKMTAEFRRNAYKSGWPTEITRKLRVEHDGGDHFFIEPNKAIKKAVLDLEQGNQNTPPNAAILRFMNRSHIHIEDYTNLIFASIMDMEIFK
jgi:hypothetical protein